MKKTIFFLAFFLFSLVSAISQTIEELHTMELTSGQKLILGDVSFEKGLILISHSMDCPFAEMYATRLKHLISTYSSQGFAFHFINSSKKENLDPAAVQAYFKTSGFSLPYLMDADQSWTQYFEITKVPEVILLTKGAEGLEIAYRGAIDNNPQAESSVSERHFERAINQILKGQKPSPSQVRAMGCNVKTF